VDLIKSTFSIFATSVNRFVSSPAATGAAFIVVLVWALFGPVTHYSNGWQLMINTGTTIITFLIVFVLNNAQSRDTTAINAKLDSLILAIERADNRLVGLERLPVLEAEAITAELESAGCEPDSVSGTNEKGFRPPSRAESHLLTTSASLRSMATTTTSIGGLSMPPTSRTVPGRL
jgi:low affinity Fe/Cu permease